MKVVMLGLSKDTRTIGIVEQYQSECICQTKYSASHTAERDCLCDCHNVKRDFHCRRKDERTWEYNKQQERFSGVRYNPRFADLF